MPRAIETYAHVWLPDDDIATDSGTIDTLFSEMARHDLLIAQPALDWDSYYTYPHTLQCTMTRLRFTDMVELMMPCFRSDHLLSLTRHFEGTATGWGLDWVWCRSAAQNACRYAILDLCRMTHTRPLGTHLYEHADSIGENASQHMEAFMENFPDVGLDFKPSCYGSISTTGKRFGGTATAFLVALSYANYVRKKQRRTARDAAREGIDLFRSRRVPNFDPLSLSLLLPPSKVAR